MTSFNLLADLRRVALVNDQLHVRIAPLERGDRKSTRLNSSHSQISYAVFCLKKKKINTAHQSLHGHLSTVPRQAVAPAHLCRRLVLSQPTAPLLAISPHAPVRSRSREECCGH